LTPKQRAAIPRLVERDLAGGSKEDLFKGDGKICHRSVYFENWVHNPVFVAALNLALAEARPAVMQSVVIDAVTMLQRLAPLAASDLERQIIGDDYALDALMRVAQNGKRPTDERLAAIVSMARIGTRRATDLLILLLDDADPNIRQSAAESIGLSAAGLNASRRLADTAVLDRADPETANKGGTEQGESIEEIGTRRWELIAPLLAQMQEAANETVAAPAISS
jgi:HEAT repeat protein